MSNIINKIRLSGTDYTLSATTSGGVTSGEVETMISAATSGYTARFAEDEEVTAAALNDLNERISGISGNNVVELTQAQYDALVSGGTVDPTAFYIITDATAGDLTQYWTSAQTQSAITSAVSTKQDTLQSGTNIKTINNESILGSGNIDIQGGGKAVSGGTNISITTGETADTINCTLPYYKLSDSYSYSIYNNNSYTNTAYRTIGSLFIGNSNKISGNSPTTLFYYNTIIGYDNLIKSYNSSNINGYNVAIGYNNQLSGTNLTNSYTFGEGNTGNTSHEFICGFNNIANNIYETVFGRLNVSNTGSTDADKTLFSVGNGTSTSARHNAFEIRQNGDIYLTKDGQDVKLQDQLGGGVTPQEFSAYTASTESRIAEDEEVTAAGLNAVNSALGGLKLQQITQSAYDALVTKDASTLYIIVN